MYEKHIGKRKVDTLVTLAKKEIAAEESTEKAKERQSWDSKLEFFLSCLSFAVGLGNVWRFPYLCYKNGGGAFLIPYVVNLVFTGLPLFFFELSLGQYARSSPVALWSICPIFQGIGYSMLLIVVGIGLYYNVIIAWILFYLVAVFASLPSGQLPWESCDNPWNTPDCQELSSSSLTPLSNLNNQTGRRDNTDLINLTIPTSPINHTSKRNTPPEEFFNSNMLQLSSGIDEMGEMRWEIAGCLLLAWVIVFIALIKGVKSLGKAVYVTAIFPYLILSILLVFGLSLEGAHQGIMFYLTPNLERLLDVQVWADAAMQIFFSLGPCWGSLITLASYNKFNNNTLRDAVFVATANCLTSFFAGFVVFSFIGFMAHSVGKSVEEVIVSGPGLAFVVYPEAVSRLPLPHVWAVLFFLMLLSLGLGTQFSIMETITRIIVDALGRPASHRLVLLVTTSLMMLVGLSMSTQGGMYVLQLMDSHAGTFPALVTGLLEVLAVSWIYGVDRFLEDIRRMIGWTGKERFYKFHKLYWTLVWKFVTPTLLLVILVASFVDYRPMTYGKYIYPAWANNVGWLVSLVSVTCIPLVMVIKVATVFLRRRSTGLHKGLCADLLRPTADWGSAERDFWCQEQEERETELALIQAEQ